MVLLIKIWVHSESKDDLVALQKWIKMDGISFDGRYVVGSHLPVMHLIQD